MLSQLKIDEFYNQDKERVNHDAHIRAYQSQRMGIKVVLCDSRGVPVSDSIAPMSSFMPNTSYNM